MNSVLTYSVLNRGLDCQSIGSVMNSVLTSSEINCGLDCQFIDSNIDSAHIECDKSWVRLPVYR